MPSGTYTFGQNRDQIIRRAARLCQAIAAGDIPSAQVTQDFSDALNTMVKRFGTMGIRVWTQFEGIVFLQPNQIDYLIGQSAADHSAMANPSTGVPQWLQTYINLAAAPGAGSVTLQSATGMISGDNIGIQLSTGTVQWTTINGAPVGNVVTLTTPLQQAVTTGALVFSYTPANQSVRPLRVVNCRRLAWNSQTSAGGNLETPMSPMLARLDYREFPSKTNVGTPTQAFYDPLGIGTVGRLSIWPAPPDATNAVRFTGQRPIQDFNVAGDTPDFPTEWLDALTFNLAKSMAPEFAVTDEQYNKIITQAQEYLDVAMGWDREPESLYAGVNLEHR